MRKSAINRKLIAMEQYLSELEILSQHSLKEYLADFKIKRACERLIQVIVESAIDLAKVFGVSEWIIGVTIVAAGTSAPEFATSVVAAVKGHHGLSVGNLIGSDIFNMFGVLGLASVIRSLSIDLSARSSIIALVFMVALVLLFIRTGWVISRREGFILVAIGLGRWTFDFLSK